MKSFIIVYIYFFLVIINLLRNSHSALRNIKSLKKKILNVIISHSILFNSFVLIPSPSIANDEYFGETSSSIGSIDFNIFKSQKEILKDKEKLQSQLLQLKLSEKENSNIKSENENMQNDLDSFLNLIPSWKYYKIIGAEYSKRSNSYSPGNENILAPLL